MRHPQSYIQGRRDREQSVPILVQCPGAVRYSQSYIQGRDREQSVCPPCGTVSRGCALQCAILSPTFKVGTEGTVCTHTWYSVQGLCATVRHPQSYIQGRDREQSVPIPGTVSRGCALQCAILSPTFKVGTGNSQYPYWYSVQGLCAIPSPTFKVGGKGNCLYPYQVQCPGAVHYSVSSSVLHSR